MGRWTRAELEDAIQVYRDTARKSATSGDWTHWAALFTDDVTYNEHHFGKFSGKDAVYRWISSIMGNYPMNHMIFFPWTWHVVDEERGWVVCELMNRMQDPGDGSLHEEPNITILHYAGNNKWNYEEDAYDFENVARMIARWQETKERCDKAIAAGRDPRQERHLARFGGVEIKA